MDVRFSWNRFISPDAARALIPPPDDDAFDFHRALLDYEPTPLVSLPALADALGLASLRVKDESHRFGLGAFKALGASYAIHRFVTSAARPGPFTFCTATDGNHGRAVAWTAKRLGHRAVIFVPQNTVPARIEAIAREGAEVVVVPGNYDATVRRAASDAAANGWQVISDTAYPGYMEIPHWIMRGYTTLFREADEQIRAAPASRAAPPNVVLLQAGVGGLLAAGALHYHAPAMSVRPHLVSVEPTDADCLLESACDPDGAPREARGRQESIMAGLNCGLPSLAAWPIVRATVDLFLAVSDDYAELAMRRLHHPLSSSDPRLVSGESGAAGLAGLLALVSHHDLAPARARLGLSGHTSHVLIISTEGATDPAGFERIVGAPP